MTLKFTSNTEKIALSSVNGVYKTESFVTLTRKILAIDAFISRVAEGIFRANLTLTEGCYAAETEDGQYTLLLCVKGNASLGNDVIFYKMVSANADEGGLDRRLKDYISARGTLHFVLSDAADAVAEEDLTRLYLVSGSDGMINFPHLNETQRRIVETEDSNMLVQGIAGSGKTNVCVEKIVYCACRNYRGSVLYTTFSRGLLSETRNRVELFLKNIVDFIACYEGGKIEFLDGNHKKAIENKLGILFSVDGDGEIISALKRIADFLRQKVDYRLIEDIYAEQITSPRTADNGAVGTADKTVRVAGESVFIKEYLSGGSGGKGFRLSGALDRIKNISPEIIYKEIYGMIFGKYELDSPQEMMGKEEYIQARSESFTRRECEIIYSVAVD